MRVSTNTLMFFIIRCSFVIFFNSTNLIQKYLDIKFYKMMNSTVDINEQNLGEPLLLSHNHCQCIFIVIILHKISSFTECISCSLRQSQNLNEPWQCKCPEVCCNVFAVLQSLWAFPDHLNAFWLNCQCLSPLH